MDKYYKKAKSSTIVECSKCLYVNLVIYNKSIDNDNDIFKCINCKNIICESFYCDIHKNILVKHKSNGCFMCISYDQQHYYTLLLSTIDNLKEKIKHLKEVKSTMYTSFTESISIPTFHHVAFDKQFDSIKKQYNIDIISSILSYDECIKLTELNINRKIYKLSNTSYIFKGTITELQTFINIKMI